MDKIEIIESMALLDDVELTDLYEKAIEEFDAIDSGEFILEAMVNAKEEFSKRFDMAMANTKDTTAKALKVYDDTTTGLGKVYKAAADFVLAVFQVIAKFTKFILNIIASVVSAGVNLINFIGNIPENIRDKLRGNIKLYITANDLQHFEKMIFPSIRSFIVLSQEFTKGDMWGTFFSRNEGRNDMELFKKMKIFAQKVNVDFVKTTIDLSVAANRNAYFSNTKFINVIDENGNDTQVNYGEALNNIMKKIQSLTPELKNIQTAFGEKVSRTELNGKIAELSASKQMKIRGTVFMIANTVKVLARFVNYAKSDLNTMNHSMKRIKEKYKIEE